MGGRGSEMGKELVTLQAGKAGKGEVFFFSFPCQTHAQSHRSSSTGRMIKLSKKQKKNLQQPL